MITQTQEQILKLLLGKPEEHLSIRHIARLLCKSYALTYNNVQKLLKAGIVKAQAVPPAQIVRLSERAPASLLVAMEMKRTEDFIAKRSWLSLYLKDVLNSVENPFFVMLIFGSYAAGMETKRSDLDLLFIAPTNDDIPALEKAAQQYTNVKKGIVVADVKGFLEMIKNPKALNLGNEARKNHLIIYGAQEYYELLKKT